MADLSLQDIHRELEIPPPSMPAVPPNPIPAQVNAVIEAKPRGFSYVWQMRAGELVRTLMQELPQCS